MKRSPLHDAHIAAGAKMVPFGGWEMPLAYGGGTIDEHLRCRGEAVMFDVSHLGTVHVPADGFEQLQRTLTNDLAKVAPGRAQYTHLLDDEGGVLDDIMVWWRPDGSFDVMPNASNTDRVVGSLGGAETTSQRAVLAIQGPDWARVLSAVVPAAAEVGRFRVATVDWQGVELVVAGTGYTGERGVEIAVPVADARRLWDELLAGGLAPAGLGARDTLRLEAGLPLHGHELGAGITPLQAGLGWVVGWSKPSFRGRDALLAERERGVARILTGVATEGRRPPRDGATVHVGGEPVGTVTSGNFSPVLEHGIALAFCRPGLAVGEAVSVEVRGTMLDGTVVELPFVRSPR